MSTAIEDVVARKVFNSRGEETIEVDVITTSGFGRASAPAGKSRGKAEVTYYPPGGVDEAVKKSGGADSSRTCWVECRLSRGNRQDASRS